MVVRGVLTYAMMTAPGERPINEDAIGGFENGDNRLFVLCDGLGGHGMGDAASALVKDVFRDRFYKTTDMVNFLGDSFLAAQQILLAEQIEQHARHKMKTTAVALAIDDRRAYIGHVGDSRVYVFKGGKVNRRTLDHSIPQMLVLSREIKESDIRHHPERNIVLRVLGVEWEEPQYELIEPLPLSKRQTFLLCSDGFWEWIDEKEMSALLRKASSPQEWLMSMADVVRQNGAGHGMDNYSAIAVWNR